jgi:CRISPR-associated endonuclease/helicase Cas3
MLEPYRKLRQELVDGRCLVSVETHPAVLDTHRLRPGRLVAGADQLLLPAHISRYEAGTGISHPLYSYRLRNLPPYLTTGAPGPPPMPPPLALWAKLGAGYPADYHPVPCHLLDVAAVARELWDHVLREPLRRRLSSPLGLEPEAAGRWVSFWVGAHDLGKISPGFQAKDQGAREALRRAGLGFPVLAGAAPHGVVSAAVLPQLLTQPDEWPGTPAALANRLAVAVGGHHGVFPRAEQTTLGPGDLGDHRWTEVRRATLAGLAAACGLATCPAPQAPPEADHAFFLLLAGLTSVADWVGSAQDYFPFAGGDVDLAAYAGLARERARRALRDLGWLGWRGAAPPTTFDRLFGFPPRPLQERAVATAGTLREPALALIEAPMGEGKTEAALFLSDHGVSALGHGGLYVALPTQATSNQMFGRVRQFLAGRYPDEKVNLHLLHGHALLSEDYQQLRLAAVYDERAGGRVVAEGWFTPKKRALLAPFGVGTIDQALLAVLQTRHVFVRLFGLANKTVVLDEVHAYDAYMSTLLDRLVAWLAALGCSVVLLSATLPRARRRQLLAAFGAREPAAPEPPYPRLLTVRGGAIGATTFAPSRHATVGLRWVDQATLGTRLREALSGGGCVAVVCNTVARAQRLYLELREALAPTGVPVGLFHARFPFGRRDRLERQVLHQFGKGGERPGAAVLVATQVIEQSLDLDFDLLVTDVAPVDLVLQRAGRLHRHAGRPRSAALAQPEVWLLRPGEAGAEGVPDFGPSEYVYDRHILLRSQLALAGLSRLNLPGDLEPLIEQVYGDLPLAVPGSAWQAALDESRAGLEEKQDRARQMARRLLIKPPDYPDDLLEDFNQQLEEDDLDIHPSLQALTRLSEPTITVVCLYRTARGLSLHPDGAGTVDLNREPTRAATKDLLRSALSLSHASLVRHFLAQEAPAGWRQSALLRHYRVAELDAAGTLRTGRFRLRLDDELGAVIEGAEGGEG